MSGNKNAVVLLWTGNDLPDYLVEKLAELLTTSGICVPELLKARVYDQQGINDALIRDLSKEDIIPQVFVGENQENKTADVIKNAVIYIGKRFEATLMNAKGNYIPFALSLDEAVREARTTASFNILSPELMENRALLEAIEALATKKAMIPTNFAKKYHVTQTVVDIVAQVYNKYYS